MKEIHVAIIGENPAILACQKKGAYDNFIQSVVQEIHAAAGPDTTVNVTKLNHGTTELPCQMDLVVCIGVCNQTYKNNHCEVVHLNNRSDVNMGPLSRNWLESGNALKAKTYPKENLKLTHKQVAALKRSVLEAIKVQPQAVA